MVFNLVPNDPAVAQLIRFRRMRRWVLLLSNASLLLFRITGDSKLLQRLFSPLALVLFVSLRCINRSLDCHHHSQP